MRLLERNDTRIADRRKDAVGMENREEQRGFSRGGGKEEARNNRRRRKRRDSFEEETLVGFARGEAFRQLELTSTTSRVGRKVPPLMANFYLHQVHRTLSLFVCYTTRNNTEKKIWRKTGRKKKKKSHEQFRDFRAAAMLRLFSLTLWNLRER